ncbi:MAG: transposase [Deltaproteobacteria bacterium]|nr:transposase [Deltaproteobacteria bacterium]
MGKVHTRTIKLKLIVSTEDKNVAWKRIRQISNDAWRAANWIASGQLFNDQLVRRIYARRKINPREDSEAVEQIEKEFEAFFGTKRQATTEWDIKEAFPDLPPYVTNPLNHVVVASYKKEKPDMLSGNRSLRTYKRGMPIQTAKAAINFSKNETGQHFVKWTLGRKEFIDFEIYYGQDRANNRLTIDRIINGQIDYSAPMIQLKDKNLFLLLPVKEPEIAADLDPDIALGVDLGVATPAYMALSKGPARRAVGDKEDFLKVRLQMQSRKRRLQRSIKSAHGGKGRQKKLKALNQIGEKERQFARTYNHYISREIVNFAIRHNAGTIKLEMLEGFGQEEQQAFVLRNWSYFELQTFIEYKAKKVGIKILKIDPYRTSQTCSSCGHFEEGQRKDQSTFECKNCGEKLHADYNAALNIARSKKIVTKKEQCEYYLNRNQNTI